MACLQTYLGLCRSSVIVTVGGGTERGTRAVLACSNASSLGQVLLSLCLANFDLLLLTAPAKLFRLEGVLRLEVRPAMLGDKLVGHGDEGSLMAGL
jgi:hypothetical protein